MVRLRVLGTIDLRGDDGAAIEPVLRQPKRLALLTWLAFNVINRVIKLKTIVKNQRALRPGHLRRVFSSAGFAGFRDLLSMNSRMTAIRWRARSSCSISSSAASPTGSSCTRPAIRSRAIDWPGSSG